MVLFAVCGMLFGTVYIVGAVRSVNCIPELLKPNTYWVCEDYDAWFSVNGKGEIKGEVTIDGEERPFCIHYREGYSDFYNCTEEDTYREGLENNIFWEASIRAKSGDLCFYITEDKWEAGIDKLIFEKR